MRAFRLILLPLLCVALTGCPPPPPPPKGYYGITHEMPEVVSRINANNARIHSLWAKMDFTAVMYDDDNRGHRVDGDGTVIYLKPGHLRMVGTKPFVGRIFEIGGNAERYWLIVQPEVSEMWWGWHRNLGKPCARELPIPPDLVTEVFGVSDIARNFLQQPVPTMRFSNEDDAYLFLWSVAGRDRWIARKEVWYDRATFLPIRVIFYDDDGRALLRAKLSEHKPVEVEGSVEGEQPRIATRYDLFFPETKTTMLFTLGSVRERNRGVPTPRSFPFPAEPGVDRITQIDADCP